MSKNVLHQSQTCQAVRDPVAVTYQAIVGGPQSFLPAAGSHTSRKTVNSLLTGLLAVCGSPCPASGTGHSSVHHCSPARAPQNHNEMSVFASGWKNNLVCPAISSLVLPSFERVERGSPPWLSSLGNLERTSDLGGTAAALCLCSRIPARGDWAPDEVKNLCPDHRLPRISSEATGFFFFLMFQIFSELLKNVLCPVAFFLCY